MVKVPPQLRGKFGFSDDPIQKVSPEQASRMAEYKSMTAEEGAIRAYKESDTAPAILGEETSQPGFDEAKFRGYRYVPRTLRRDEPIPRRKEGQDIAELPEMDDTRVLGHPDLGQDMAELPEMDDTRVLGYPDLEFQTDQPGAGMDPRFWMVNDRGRVVPRPDQGDKYEAAMVAGEFFPPVAEGLPDDYTRPAGWSQRRSRWLADRKDRRSTKAGRLRSRRRLKHMKAVRQHNIADQMRSNQPAWMNVRRFPGESDEAYAARYGAFANMMGQGMAGRGGRGGRGGGDDFSSMVGPFLQYILGMNQGDTSEYGRKRLELTARLARLEDRIDREDEVSGIGGAQSTTDKAKDLRSQAADTQRQLRSLKPPTGRSPFPQYR
jgi:hypothetical protein